MHSSTRRAIMQAVDTPNNRGATRQRRGINAPSRRNQSSFIRPDEHRRKLGTPACLARRHQFFAAARRHSRHIMTTFNPRARRATSRRAKRCAHRRHQQSQNRHQREEHTTRRQRPSWHLPHHAFTLPRRLRIVNRHFAAIPSAPSNSPSPARHPGRAHTYSFNHMDQGNSGGAGEVRTPDKRFRKPLLYPSELQPHSMPPPDFICISRNPKEKLKTSTTERHEMCSSLRNHASLPSVPSRQSMNRSSHPGIYEYRPPATNSSV